MANKATKGAKAGSPPLAPERYPKVEIDRSFAAESSRRNIDVIVWYKRLISATFALIAASIFFTVIAVLFAFFQPLPSLYGSGLDGSLRRIDYVRNMNDPRLPAMRAALTSEAASRSEIGMEKTSAAKLPIAAVARPPTVAGILAAVPAVGAPALSAPAAAATGQDAIPVPANR